VLAGWSDDHRSHDEPVVIREGELLFSLLVLVARVAEPEAPFFATVWEASPWRMEVSS